MHVHLPRGFGNGEDSVLKLLKSLYGTRFAPLYWFRELRSTLVKDLGFEQSKNDQCLFVHKAWKIIVLVHTDDALCFACEEEDLDLLVSDLKKKHDLDDHSPRCDVCDYLGVEVNMEGEMVELRQDGLTTSNNCIKGNCPNAQIICTTRTIICAVLLFIDRHTKRLCSVLNYEPTCVCVHISKFWYH